MNESKINKERNKETCFIVIVKQENRYKTNNQMSNTPCPEGPSPPKTMELAKKKKKYERQNQCRKQKY